MATDFPAQAGYFVPTIIFVSAILFCIFLHVILKAWVKKADGNSGEQLLKKNGIPLYAFILMMGLYFALRVSPFYVSHEGIITTVFPIVIIFMFGMLIANLLNSGDSHQNKDK